MEAVAAVGIAAAAAQFLDFSIKTLALCKEIRDSSSGSTKTNDELTKSIKKLTAMQKDLRQSGSTPSSTYRQLIRAVQDCSVVASELLKLLEDIREVAKESLGTMRSALKAIKERKSIEKLQARLLDCQNRYHIALTTDLRDEVLRLLERQGKNTDSVRDIILQQLSTASSKSAVLHAITHGKLHTLGEDLNQSARTVQNQLSALRLSQQSSNKTLQTGQRNLGKTIDGQFQRLSASDTHQNFLDMLYFPEMFARQESMMRRSPGTYEWVFSGKLEKSNKKKELQGRISCWLRNTDKNNIFWIQGKPGSGKSSLVSFIMGDRRTKECMQPWAGGHDPHIFSFFFWNPGSSLQKTMLGLRRSLLWQLCKAKPVIIEKLLSRDFTLMYSPFTHDKLALVLDQALSYYQEECVLFLIDGLDECEGNHNDLLDELHSMRFGQRNKICLSSRPEEALRRRLEPLPFVRLQDLNYRDIFKYARKKLQIGGDPESELASRVAEKAEGVFLWAVLVCDSLSSGVIAKDSENNMLRRLHIYPRGLDDLFHRMFSDIEEIHYKSLALYFYAAQQRRFSVAMAVASQQPRKFMSIVEFGDSCELEMTRITAQSRGLLQINDSRIIPHDWTHGWTLLDISSNHISREPLEYGDLQIFKKHLATNIAFVHRSAYDYIFDIANNERPAWLRPVGGPEMIHSIVDGSLWLANVLPVVVASPRQMDTRQDTEIQIAHTVFTFGSSFDAIATDDVPKLDWELLYEGLDRYVGALHAWTAVSGSDPTSTLSDFMAHDYSGGPWTAFWRIIMRLEPRFFTSRMYRFWDRDDAYLETITLLIMIEPDWMGTMGLSFKPTPTETYRAMRSALNDFRFQGRANSSIADFPYAGERRYCSIRVFSSPSQCGVLSWFGTGVSHERLIARYLSKAVHDTLRRKGPEDNTHGSESRRDHEQESHSRAYVLSDIFICVQAITDTWKLFAGKLVGTSRDGKIPSRLQLSMPIYYSQPRSLPYPVNNEAMMDKVLSCKPRLTLRLSCFAKIGPGPFVEQKEQDRSGTNFFATTTYHLSLGITILVMAHNKKEDDADSPNFVGTTAERSTCMDLILTDLWDDVDGQLTAWEQLYVRAYVKVYFACHWKVE
jgi:hypothetical protein